MTTATAPHPNQYTGVTQADRFWPRVDQTGDCWLWTGALNASGYGVFYADGASCLAHRWSIETALGQPIPHGMEVDHLCRVRACVRPSHLDVVTPDENKRRTALNNACQQGHPRTPRNTFVRKDGERYCRECKRIRDRAAYRRRRLAVENGAPL